MSDEGRIVLEIRNARDSEESPQAMEQIFAAIGTAGSHGGFLSGLFGPKHPTKTASFEIVAANASIHFFVVTDKHIQPFMESQLSAQYPRSVLSEVNDYAGQFLSAPHALGQLVMTNYFYLPMKTYKDVKEIDLLSSVLGQMAKLAAHEAVMVQIRVEPAGHGWQHAALSVVAHGIPDPNSHDGRTKTHPQARLIQDKANQTGLLTTIRIAAVSQDNRSAEGLLHALASTYGVFGLGEGNNLSLSLPHFWQTKKLEEAFIGRTGGLSPKGHVFTAAELATIWHPPGLTLAAIKNIAWGARLASLPPENLPVATESEEEKKLINFFARTEYKNRNVTFGIKKEDRRKHMYVIGKTGSGKSTLIANMVINDMRNGEGLAVIDPHGDLSEIILDYVPSYRINDVAYLDPSDADFAFRLNPLEVKNQVYRELIASGIVSIFHKLYHFTWGPRLEYILRNAILTLLSIPQATLLQVPELLTNEKYRARVVEKLDDQVLKNYWMYEFDKMSPQMRSEAISPILNKVGQFLSSMVIRNVIGHPVSTVDLESLMNDGKIVILNLSQGKLGEDSSALLGSMFITKFQLAAMNRVYMTEGSRRDFYLYVDEFQNFATNSFVKILSEARKYHLNLTLANQYIGQIDEDIQKAIFGNVGSLLSFGIGAQDARMLAREFGSIYKEEELVGMGNYQIVTKLSIDNHTTTPFVGTTLPLPRSKNQNREKVVRSSRERYTKKIEAPVTYTPPPLVDGAPGVQGQTPVVSPLGSDTQKNSQERQNQPYQGQQNQQPARPFDSRQQNRDQNRERPYQNRNQGQRYNREQGPYRDQQPSQNRNPYPGQSQHQQQNRTQGTQQSQDQERNNGQQQDRQPGNQQSVSRNTPQNQNASQPRDWERRS